MKNALVYIRDGQIVNKYTVKNLFELPDGKYEVTIVKRNRRSLSQNAYYWSCVVKSVHDGLQNMGNDVSMEETHAYLKARFNSKEVVNTVTGEVLTVPKSTTELSKENFGIYIERIQQFASEYLGIVIPSPGEQSVIYYE